MDGVRNGLLAAGIGGVDLLVLAVVVDHRVPGDGNQRGGFGLGVEHAQHDGVGAALVGHAQQQAGEHAVPAVEHQIIGGRLRGVVRGVRLHRRGGGVRVAVGIDGDLTVHLGLWGEDVYGGEAHHDDEGEGEQHDVQAPGQPREEAGFALCSAFG